MAASLMNLAAKSRQLATGKFLSGRFSRQAPGTEFGDQPGQAAQFFGFQFASLHPDDGPVGGDQDGKGQGNEFRAEAFSRGSLQPISVKHRDFTRQLSIILHRHKYRSRGLQQWLDLCLGMSDRAR